MRVFINIGRFYKFHLYTGKRVPEGESHSAGVCGISGSVDYVVGDIRYTEINHILGLVLCCEGIYAYVTGREGGSRNARTCSVGVVCQE